MFKNFRLLIWRKPAKSNRGWVKPNHFFLRFIRAEFHVEKYKVAIIGAGPAGLSAAARAAAMQKRGDASLSYILLEGFDQVAKTIYQFQKAKPVMAEPGYLDHRSDVTFAAGSRENVLETWNREIGQQQLNIRYRATVLSVTGNQGNFQIGLEGGDKLAAENVVLAIGLQGNPRKLGVDRDDAEYVQYSLSDPDEYHGENIVVVGAGDAAIENALALAKNNHVKIINRRGEFNRAKEGNLSAILNALNDPSVNLECCYDSNVAEIIEGEFGALKKVVLDSAEGKVELDADRIIARLGAEPPRRLIESFGVEFPSASKSALPELSERYESNVKGLYIVGALAGYPLIKQAMNQGYDVIQTIAGKPIAPVDYSLLELQFSQFPFQISIDQALDLLREKIPMFRQIPKLALKEVLIECDIIVTLEDESYQHAVANQGRRRSALEEEVRQGKRQKLPRLPILQKVGATLFQAGEYASEFYTVLDGTIEVEFEHGSRKHRLGAGEFVGENGMLSGSSHDESVFLSAESIVVGIPRRIAARLMNSFSSIETGINRIHSARVIARKFAPNAMLSDIYKILGEPDLRTFNAGAQVYKLGDVDESLYYLKHGNVVRYVTDEKHGRRFVSQNKSGELFGELAVMGASVRQEEAVASVRSEVIVIAQAVYDQLAQIDPDQIHEVKKNVSLTARSQSTLAAKSTGSDTLRYLFDIGLGEATNAFVIDESLCVGCDNCEKACAETHQGISRVKRAKGPSHNQLHVPVTCRHCEIPHCMKDCPPNALQRSERGEVFIDDSCIGCGNCVINCPYDAIELEAVSDIGQQSLISKILFGEAGAKKSGPSHANAPRKAVKCDACKDDPLGPACERACPTGAAARVDPIDFIKQLKY